MKHATLRQLKVFEAVARCLSHSRAADELHLSQPAVSIQIRKLAEHAGQPLFEQLGKRIFLTQPGSELLHHCRLIIAQFDAAEDAMAQFKGISGGRLNVAVISAGDYYFPRLLVEFAGRHKGIGLNLTVLNREEMLVHLADNLTDLAVMGRPPVGADTDNQAFAPHPYVIVCPAGHPLTRERGLSFARLAREPFIVREPESDTWHSMTEAFGSHMAQLNVAMQIKSTETIKQAVIAGMGLGFLSAHTVSRELAQGTLQTLDVQGFPFVLNWYVVQRSNKRLPPVALAFKRFLLDEGARLIDESVPVPPAGRASRRRGNGPSDRAVAKK